MSAPVSNERDWPAHRFEPGVEKPEGCVKCGRVRSWWWHVDDADEPGE